MRKQTKAQREKARLLKAARAAIRLKYSLAADDEINDRLPDIEAEIDKALATGEVFVLDVQSVLES